MDALLERQIQDTTGSADGDVCTYQCSCGTTFSENDEGTSATLKLCKVCFLKLNKLLETTEAAFEAGNNNAATDDDDALGDGNHVNDSGGYNDAATAGSNLVAAAAVGLDDDAPGDGNSVHDGAENVHGNDDDDHAEDSGGPDAADATAGNIDAGAGDDGIVTMETIGVIMQLAAKDSTGLFTVNLNGQKETFKYMSDPINGNSSRLMFARESWTFTSLYWYDMFGAMQTAHQSIVTPAAFRAKDGSIYVCYGIGRTMCHRPRYDGLCVNTETKTVSFVQNIVNAIDQVVLDYPFDTVEIKSMVNDFITRNRWVYNAERGLKITCKEPMKPDTALKKYMANPRARKEGEDAEVEVQEKQQHAEPQVLNKTKKGIAKPVVGSKKPVQSTKQVVASKWAPSKKISRKTKVADLESSSSSSESDDEETIKEPPAKKTRKTAPPPPSKIVPMAVAMRESSPVESQIITVDAVKSTNCDSSAPMPASVIRNLEPPPSTGSLSALQTSCADGVSVDMFHIMSGLLFDNMKQRSRLEEQRSRLEAMERNEAARREESERSEFQKHLTMFFSSSKK